MFAAVLALLNAHTASQAETGCLLYLIVNYLPGRRAASNRVYSESVSIVLSRARMVRCDVTVGNHGNRTRNVHQKTGKCRLFCTR